MMENKKKELLQGMISVIERRGYEADVMSVDGEVEVQVFVEPWLCGIYYDERTDRVYYNLTLEVEEEGCMDDEEILHRLDEEGLPFDEIEWTEVEDSCMLILSGDIPVSEFGEDVVDELISAAESEEGVIAEIKNFAF